MESKRPMPELRKAVQELLNAFRQLEDMKADHQAVTYEHGAQLINLVERHAALLVRVLETYP